MTSTSALIGQQFGSDGTVTVTGLGASWTNDGSLDVGFQGQGTLAVTGGAAVFTHGFAVIGSFPEPVFPPVSGGLGDVTISGPASLWMVDGDLYVGLQWIGTLDILDGATVTSQSGIVGTSDQPGNVANVEGPGSVWDLQSGRGQCGNFRGDPAIDMPAQRAGTVPGAFFAPQLGDRIA